MRCHRDLRTNQKRGIPDRAADARMYTACFRSEAYLPNSRRLMSDAI
jgi:hypothetical protein